MEDTSGNHDDVPYEATCPICLHETSRMVSGNCRHEFCLPCIERLLLSPPTNLGSSNYLFDSSASFATPTLGSCPMCRQELYLFDLQCSNTGQKVYHEASDASLPDELKGAIFVESTEQHRGIIGRGSYHFPSDSEKAPFYDTSQIPRHNNNHNNNDSTDENQHRLEFVDYHWHEESRTFAGVLPLPQSRIFSHYQVVLSFSPDWRFVRQGAIIKRRRRDFENEAQIQQAYPFDGKWIISNSKGMIFEQGFPTGRNVSVQGYHLTESISNDPWMIQPRDMKDDTRKTTLMCLATMQKFESTTELANSMDDSIVASVPSLGCEVSWRDPTDNSVHMTWKRISHATKVPPDQPNLVGGSSGRLLLRPIDNESDTFMAIQRRRAVPGYNRNGVWGNVFCQAFQVGLASYHFESLHSDSDTNESYPPQAYIAYEHPSTGRWPPLDNGQSVPAKVQFHNISFDQDTRTFRGHICWQEDYGTCWQGMMRWEYEMIFDQYYTCIVAGSVTMFNIHNLEQGEEMSRYGESLIYCNAKMWEIFRDNQCPYEEDNRDNDSDRYRTLSSALRLGLQEQGASVRTIAMMHSILTSAAQDPQGRNPIDYNL